MKRKCGKKKEKAEENLPKRSKFISRSKVSRTSSLGLLSPKSIARKRGVGGTRNQICNVKEKEKGKIKLIVEFFENAAKKNERKDQKHPLATNAGGRALDTDNPNNIFDFNPFTSSTADQVRAGQSPPSIQTQPRRNTNCQKKQACNWPAGEEFSEPSQ